MKKKITFIEVIIVIVVIVIVVKGYQFWNKPEKVSEVAPVPTKTIVIKTTPVSTEVSIEEPSPNSSQNIQENVEGKFEIVSDIFENIEGMEFEDYKVLLIAFLCFGADADCGYRIPPINELYDKYREEGLETVIIGYSESIGKELIEKYNINCKVLYASPETMFHYADNTLPKYLLIDKKGRVLYRDFHIPEKRIIDKALEDNVQEKLECPMGF